MTDQTASGPAWIPDACTLPAAQRPLRLAEFDTLFATAVRQAEKVDTRRLRLVLAGAADLETTVRHVAARESDCCSFFSFTVTAPQPGRVLLDIEVPAAYVDVLDALANRAITGRGSRP